MESPRPWSSAYRASLKPPELEERLDLLVYRPLAFLIAWPLRRSSISPNQVSVASALCGVAAGFLFWRATPGAALAAGVVYFAGNVLDCVDGQLARLQGSSSPIGYLVDGAADYVGTIAVFVGMAHGLGVRRPMAVSWWWLAIAAGASMAWQCAFLDEKRGAWQDRVYRKRRDRGEELEIMMSQARTWKSERSHPLGRALIGVYEWYRRVWNPLTRAKTGAPSEDSAEDGRAMDQWARCHRPVLRCSVWTGPTMHVTAIVVLAGFADRAEWYFASAVVLGNIGMLVTLLAERRARRCAAGTAGAAGARAAV